MKRVLSIYAETGVHVRAKERSSEAFSLLPLDPMSGLPTVPESSVAGAVRRWSGVPEAELEGFSALRIMLFPFRAISFHLTALPILWGTSIETVERFFQESGLASVLPTELPRDRCILSSRAPLQHSPVENRVFFESVSFETTVDDRLKEFAVWIANTLLPQGDEYQFVREALPERLIILPHQEFAHLSLLSTEVVPQLSVSDPATSESFFYREYLPSECFGFVTVGEEGRTLLESAEAKKVSRIQIGADETRGRGICAIRVV